MALVEPDARISGERDQFNDFDQGGHGTLLRFRASDILRLLWCDIVADAARQLVTPMIDTIIANATPADLLHIAEIERLCFSHPWSAADFEAELHRDWSRLKVLRLGQTPHEVRPVAAFILYWLVHDQIQLLKVATHPHYLRRGFARRLIAEMLAEGRQRNALNVTLEVRRSNEEARRLYHSLGFAHIGVRRAYYRDGEDALLLELKLR